MYVSVFGRASEGDGNTYWQTDPASTDMVTTANIMLNTEAAQTYFGDTINDNAAFIAFIYNNTLGKSYADDSAGQDYWVAELAGGKSKGEVVAALITAAQAPENAGPAQDQFNNKVAVSNYAADTLSTFTTIEAFTAFISNVDNTADSVTVAEAAVNMAVPSSTFTLTNGTDIASATVFEAGLVYTPGGDDRINSLQDEDQLTGTGTGTTLNATLGNANDNGGTIITPKLTNVEVINVAFTGSGGGAVTGLDLQDATGQTAVNISRVSQAVNYAEVGNINDVASQLSLSNTNANTAGIVEFSYAAGVLHGLNTGDMTVSNVQLGTLNIGENTSGIGTWNVSTNGFENLTLHSAGAANNVIGTLNLPMDTGTAGSLIIDGSANMTLGAKANIVNNLNAALVEAVDVWTAGTGVAQAGGRIATIDASGLTGNLTIVLDNILDVGKADTSGVKQDVTVTGGSGDDTFILHDAVQAGDSIVGGGGNDSLVFYTGSSLASVVSDVEAGSMFADGNAPVAAGTPLGQIALDYDFLPGATSMTVRNISSNGIVNTADPAVNFLLTDMTADQAAAITVQHSTTGNGQIANTKIEAAVKANTAADLLGVTIAEGTNVDPRFNFTIDTSVANNATSTTAASSTFESVTITDADSESNSVELSNFAQHTGTVTLTGGVAGTYLNLDVDTAGADVATVARYGTSLLVNTTAAATGVQQGMYALNTDGLAVDFATGNIYDPAGLTTEVRLGAATINAADELANVIVRVSTNVADVNGAQSITMGAGDDTVIFDYLNDARAGLTISDTVAGGAGNDTLAIDGNATRISLGASEWTNVTGFENLRLVGNGTAAVSDLIGQNSYNLALTDALISANHGADGLLNIINDNDSNNDNLAKVATVSTPGLSTGENTTGTGAESAVTIDARALSATSHFSYNGEEGGWLDAGVFNGLYDIGEGAGLGTQDKFIFADANINGGNVIDGGAVDNLATTFGGNLDVLEVRNSATVTTGDLANIKNIGIIAGSNDQATVQTLVLQLNDTVIDSMVDSYHTSTTTEQEALTIRMNAAADVTPVALQALDLDVSQTTARSVVNVTLDAAGAADNVKLGMGIANITNFDSGAVVTNDNVTLSASQFGIAAAAIGTNVAVTGSNIIFAAAAAAVTDRIVADNVTVAGQTSVYYDADGSGAGSVVLIGVFDADLGGAGSGFDIVA